MDLRTRIREMVEGLPPEQLPEACGALAEAQALLQVRLVGTGQVNGQKLAPKAPTAPPDRLLTSEEAATMLGVDVRWLYRRADKLPFTRKLGPRTLRFSEAGIRRWLETRK